MYFPLFNVERRRWIVLSVITNQALILWNNANSYNSIQLRVFQIKMSWN